MTINELKKQLPDNVSVDKADDGDYQFSNKSYNWVINVSHTEVGNINTNGQVPHNVMDLVLTYANTPVNKRANKNNKSNKVFRKLHRIYKKCFNYGRLGLSSCKDCYRLTIFMNPYYSDITDHCVFDFDKQTGFLTRVTGNVDEIPVGTFRVLHDYVDKKIDNFFETSAYCLKSCDSANNGSECTYHFLSLAFGQSIDIILDLNRWEAIIGSSDGFDDYENLRPLCQTAKSFYILTHQLSEN